MTTAPRVTGAALWALLVATHVLAPSTADAQATRFAKKIGGVPWSSGGFSGNGFDEGFDLIEARDGGHVVVGYTMSYGVNGHEVLLVKFDALGGLLWSRIVGGSGTFDVGSGIIQASDDTFVVVGSTNGYGAGSVDLLLAKFGSDGTPIWTRVFGESGAELGQTLIEARDGGFYAAGTTTSFDAGMTDLLLTRFDPNGNLLWASRVVGPGADFVGANRSLVQLVDGSLIAVGNTGPGDGGPTDALIVKLDAAGNLVWAKTLGGPSMDKAASVVEAEDGGFVLVGTTESFDAGGGDVIVSRFDPDGNLAWLRMLGGPLAEYGIGILRTTGGYAFTGGTKSFSSVFSPAIGDRATNILLVKVDSTGLPVWASELAFGADAVGSWGKCLARSSSDDGYVLSGETQTRVGSPAQLSDLPIVKYDSSGASCNSLFVSLSVASPVPTITSLTFTTSRPTLVVSPVTMATSTPSPTATPYCEGTPDGGTPDGGTPDGGTPDAGTPDAGTPDAGAPDAAVADGGDADAGGLADGGSNPAKGGCGCGAGAPGLVVLFAPLLAWFIGRRRGRQSVSARR